MSTVKPVYINSGNGGLKATRRQHQQDRRLEFFIPGADQTPAAKHLYNFSVDRWIECLA